MNAELLKTLHARAAAKKQNENVTISKSGSLHAGLKFLENNNNNNDKAVNGENQLKSFSSSHVGPGVGSFKNKPVKKPDFIKPKPVVIASNSENSPTNGVEKPCVPKKPDLNNMKEWPPKKTPRINSPENRKPQPHSPENRHSLDGKWPPSASEKNRTNNTHSTFKPENSKNTSLKAAPSKTTTSPKFQRTSDLNKEDDLEKAEMKDLQKLRSLSSVRDKKSMFENPLSEKNYPSEKPQKPKPLPRSGATSMLKDNAQNNNILSVTNSTSLPTKKQDNDALNNVENSSESSISCPKQQNNDNFNEGENSSDSLPLYEVQDCEIYNDLDISFPSPPSSLVSPTDEQKPICNDQEIYNDVDQEIYNNVDSVAIATKTVPYIAVEAKPALRSNWVEDIHNDIDGPSSVTSQQPSTQEEEEIYHDVGPVSANLPISEEIYNDVENNNQQEELYNDVETATNVVASEEIYNDVETPVNSEEIYNDVDAPNQCDEIYNDVNTPSNQPVLPPPRASTIKRTPSLQKPLKSFGPIARELFSVPDGLDAWLCQVLLEHRTRLRNLSQLPTSTSEDHLYPPPNPSLPPHLPSEKVSTEQDEFYDEIERHQQAVGDSPPTYSKNTLTKKKSSKIEKKEKEKREKEEKARKKKEYKTFGLNLNEEPEVIGEFVCKTEFTPGKKDHHMLSYTYGDEINILKSNGCPKGKIVAIKLSDKKLGYILRSEFGIEEAASYKEEKEENRKSKKESKSKKEVANKEEKLSPVERPRLRSLIPTEDDEEVYEMIPAQQQDDTPLPPPPVPTTARPNIQTSASNPMNREEEGAMNEECLYEGLD